MGSLYHLASCVKGTFDSETKSLFWSRLMKRDVWHTNLSNEVLLDMIKALAMIETDRNLLPQCTPRTLLSHLEWSPSSCGCLGTCGDSLESREHLLLSHLEETLSSSFKNIGIWKRHAIVVAIVGHSTVFCGQFDSFELPLIQHKSVYNDNSKG